MNSRFFDSTSTSPHDDAGLDTLVLSLMNRYNVHAVGYALIDNNKIKRVKTINNMTSEAPSLFQAASFSKSITAFAVLDLISQYKIKLDLSINAFMHLWKIEGSPFNDLITVRHCLNMTSGLCFGDPGTSLSRYSREAQVPKLLDILCGKAPATNPPVKVVFEPGSPEHEADNNNYAPVFF